MSAHTNGILAGLLTAFGGPAAVPFAEAVAETIRPGAAPGALTIGEALQNIFLQDIASGSIVGVITPGGAAAFGGQPVATDKRTPTQFVVVGPTQIAGREALPPLISPLLPIRPPVAPPVVQQVAVRMPAPLPLPLAPIGPLVVLPPGVDPADVITVTQRFPVGRSVGFVAGGRTLVPVIHL